MCFWRLDIEDIASNTNIELVNGWRSGINV